MFPICIYNIHTNAKFEEEGITLPIFVYYLSCLAMLHYYWMGLLLKLLKEMIMKGETEDPQNKVEFVDKD